LQGLTHVLQSHRAYRWTDCVAVDQDERPVHNLAAVLNEAGDRTIIGALYGRGKVTGRKLIPITVILNACTAGSLAAAGTIGTGAFFLILFK